MTIGNGGGPSANERDIRSVSKSPLSPFSSTDIACIWFGQKKGQKLRIRRLDPLGAIHLLILNRILQVKMG